MSTIDDVRSALTELWGQLGPYWAVSPMTARVYGYMLSKKDPVTAEQMMEDIVLSRGAVSMACRELMDWGLIESARVEGSRQLAYKPETDLEKVIRSIVRARKRKEWDPMLEKLREWIPKLAGEKSEEARVFRDRLAQLESIVSLAEASADSFLKGGLLQQFGLKALIATANKRAKKKAKDAP
jgi:DNA-binding transcriptional regulator GbsR (MarR family)